MRDDAEAVTLEEKHLRAPVVGRKGPAMAEDDGLPRTPILIENLDAVLRGDRRHDIDPSRCFNSDQHWLQKKGARDVAVADMAAYAGLEERTFLRRFREATEFDPKEY